MKHKFWPNNVVEREKRLLEPPAGGRQSWALAYPNSYHLGMSNLGFQVVYRILNTLPGVYCHRVFHQHQPGRSGRGGRGPLTLEGHRPVSEYGVVAFSLSYELDLPNLAGMLIAGGIPAFSASRGEHDPLVVAGGPAVALNPEPIADLVDVVVTGEAEGIVPAMVEVLDRAGQGGWRRSSILEQWARIPGVYVPSFFPTQPLYDGGAGVVVTRSGSNPQPGRPRPQPLLEPAHSVIITPESEFADTFLVEVARGCPFGCGFCTVALRLGPWRPFALAAIRTALKRGREFTRRVGLIGASLGSHPDIVPLVEDLAEDGIQVGFASFRLETLSGDLIRALARAGQRTLTVAPESAEPEVGRILGKPVGKERLLEVAMEAIRAGIPDLKLYAMIGVPGEEDPAGALGGLVEELSRARGKVGSRGVIKVSVNQFVPKAFTALEDVAQASPRAVEKIMAGVRHKLASLPGVHLALQSPREAYFQGLLARGGRQLGPWLVDISSRKSWNAWQRSLDELGIDPREIMAGGQGRERRPWNHLDNDRGTTRGV